MPRACLKIPIFAGAGVTRLKFPRKPSFIHEPPYVGCYLFNGLLRCQERNLPHGSRKVQKIPSWDDK